MGEDRKRARILQCSSICVLHEHQGDPISGDRAAFGSQQVQCIIRPLNVYVGNTAEAVNSHSTASSEIPPGCLTHTERKTERC